MAPMSEQGGSEPPEPTPPPGVDPEEYRRFQEFQRFQEYQRFVEAQKAADQPTPPEGTGGLVPTRPGGPVPYVPPAPPVPQGPRPGQDIHQHLAGMSQQLAALTASQERVERVVNPPMWRKVLRNKWLHRLVGLVVVVVLGVWGLPLLISNLFGGNGGASSGGNPHPGSLEEKHVYTQGALQTVFYTYLAIGNDNPANNDYAKQMCLVFGTAARKNFADAAGIPAGGTQASRCEQAVAELHAKVTPGSDYGNAQPNLLDLAEPRANQNVVAYSSCPVQADTSAQSVTTPAGVPVLSTFRVSGGPALGTFTLTRGSGNEWYVSDYSAQPVCAATTPTASPTS